MARKYKAVRYSRRHPKAGWVDPESLPKGRNGLPLCRCGCRKEVCPPRRTFYSNACVIDWKIRTRPKFARYQVWLRDKGVCRKCKIDTKTLSHAFNPHRIRGKASDHPKLVKLGFRPGSNLWAMDHIKPVSEGGGSAGLDNLQTLCYPCHHVKTTKEAKRRAARKRKAKKK